MTPVAPLSPRHLRFATALCYAKQNVAIFPCRPGGKEPAFKGSFHNATTDVDVIHGWFTDADYNFAFEPERAGVAVIDIDPRHGGDETWAALTADNHVPATSTVRTPSGGRHLYFKGSVPQTAGKLGPGVDTRGRGGYVLLPGSIVNGVEYRAEGDTDMADLPEWIAAALARPKHTTLEAPANVVFDDDATIAWAIGQIAKRIAEKGEPVDGQNSDQRTFNLACELRDGDRRGYSLAPNTNTALLCEHWAPHFDRDWIEAKVTSAYNQAPGRNPAGVGPPGIERHFPPSEAAKYAAASDYSGTPVGVAGADPTKFGSVLGSDADLATRFVNTHGAGLRYVDQSGRWLRFAPRRWTETSFPAVCDLVRAEAKAMVKEIAANDPTIAVSTLRGFESAQKIAAGEKLARGFNGILTAPDALDADPMLFNAAGQAVMVDTGSSTPLTPAMLCSKSAAVVPGGECPLWRSFLAEITGNDEELQKYLQRIAGYCLTGLVTEHALFFLYGTGANGKGVFINTLTGIWGEYAKVAPADMLTESRGDRHPTDMAMLQGARLVVAQEINEGRIWDEAKVKALTGGDPVTARFMRQDFFTYVPQFKLMIASNHKPRLRVVDEAMRRRLHMIPFAVTIAPEKRDSELPTKLTAEWPGILTWAMDGCQAWRRDGLSPPPVVVELSENYLASQDSLAEWLEDCCTLGADKWASLGDLYASYQAHPSAPALAHGERLGKNQFGDKLEGRGFDRHKQGAAATRGFRGIGLKCITPATPAQPW